MTITMSLFRLKYYNKYKQFQLELFTFNMQNDGNAKCEKRGPKISSSFKQYLSCFCIF